MMYGWKVIEGWRKLRNEAVCDLYSKPNVTPMKFINLINVTIKMCPHMLLLSPYAYWSGCSCMCVHVDWPSWLIVLYWVIVNDTDCMGPTILLSRLYILW